MRVLVLGANGQVGRCLMEARWAPDFSVVGAVRAEADFTRFDTVAKTVARASPDLVINAAAYTAVDTAESDRDTAFAVNASAVGDLAALTAHLNIPLFHISTDYVFDGAGSRPFGEDDPVAPLSVYGASKAEGEVRLRKSQPRHIILRTSWVYAAHGANFVRTMQRLGRERDTVKVVADQHGAPTSAHDIASVLIALAARYHRAPAVYSNLWGTYHFSARGETTWHGLAAHVFADMQRRTGRSPVCHAITTADYPTPARRPANSRLDCAKFDRAFALPRMSWQTGVDAVLATFADRS